MFQGRRPVASGVHELPGPVYAVAGGDLFLVAGAVRTRKRAVRAASRESPVHRRALAKLTGDRDMTRSCSRLPRSRTGCWWLLAMVGFVACGGGPSAGEDLDEETPAVVERHVQGDLRARVQDARLTAMPGPASEGFVDAASHELDRWREAVAALLEGDTTTVTELVDGPLFSYALIHLTDTETGDTYYILQEVPSVQMGWGTVVVNPDPDRNVAVEVPHPMFEVGTDVEGADLFRRAGARALIIAGTHRCANRAPSPCDGESGVCGTGYYHVSDMAHMVEVPFQAAHELTVDRFPGAVSLSLHGHGRDRCETVFLSSGVADSTPETVRDLRRALTRRGISAAVPESSDCPLIGSTNVQGRYSNGSDQPCTRPAPSASGTFIHIEQGRSFRESEETYSTLIAAVEEIFPQVDTTDP